MERRGTVLEAARCRYLWPIFTLPSPNGEQDTEALGLAVCVESVSDSGSAVIVTWPSASTQRGGATRGPSGRASSFLAADSH